MLYAPSPHSPPAAMALIADALSAWRAAERDLGEHAEGCMGACPESTLIRAQVETLRRTYHQLFEERVRRPDPQIEPVLVQWGERLKILVRMPTHRVPHSQPVFTSRQS